MAENPNSLGVFAGSAPATLARADVRSIYLVQGDHGFEFQIRDGFRDGKTHYLAAYGLDATGNPNSQLQASPLAFTLNR